MRVSQCYHLLRARDAECDNWCFPLPESRNHRIYILAVDLSVELQS